MAILKKIIIILVSLFLLASAGIYLYVQSLPTGAPEYVTIDDLNESGDLTAFSCTRGEQLNVAYDVTVTVASELNGQAVYDSRLRFKTQLSQSNDNVVKGLASDIRINEGGGDNALRDVLYLTKVNAGEYAVFSSFNSLGLIEKHPMAIVSQLIKALSVGSEDENYFFPYDAMQRTYRYRHTPEGVERAVYPTTANLEKFLNSFNEYKSDWSVQLGDGCLPQSLQSNERQIISAAGHQGFIRFKIEAQRIMPYRDLTELDYTAYANSGNNWNVKQVDGDNLASEITDEDKMWAAISAFGDNKNVATLKQAANYMLDNLAAEDAKNALLQQDLDDALKRDLIFALGLTGRDDAESFMLETLTALPTQAGVVADLQKVRLMVSLSSNGKVTQQSFDTFSNLATNPGESANVRNNALINMGTTVKTLNASGESTAHMQEQLKQYVSGKISSGGNESASAILAAGNAGLEGLGPQMVNSLSSNNSKERYASGAVLSRDSAYRQTLIEHISKEGSNLVNNAILSNWKATELSQAERSQLQNIAQNSDANKAGLINGFLATE